MNGIRTTSPRHRPASRPRRRPRFARAIAGIELFVGAAALVAGVLMVVRPDGALIAADPAVLAATPFPDWTIPGVLLAVLVGGGLLLACAAEWSGSAAASALSAAAGAGLVAFEVVQLALIGWHPLQPIMMTIGLLLGLLVNIRVARRSSAVPSGRTRRLRR